MAQRLSIQMTANGTRYEGDVAPRKLLSDFLREDMGLNGVRVSCEQGVCGSCTIMVDGRTVRSCLMLAVQADGADIVTVEGLAPSAGHLHPVQQAFWEQHGLQCGFCTPGMLMATVELLQQHPDPSEAQIREGISGNICRCTGYVHIVNAVRAAAEALRKERLL